MGLSYEFGKSPIKGTKVVEVVSEGGKVAARRVAETRCAKTNCNETIGTRPYVVVDGRFYHYDPCARSV